MVHRAESIRLDEQESRPGRNTVADALIRALLIAISVAFLATVLFAPLATVFVEALRQGLGLYFETDSAHGAAR